MSNIWYEIQHLWMQIFLTHDTKWFSFLQRDRSVNLGVSACIRPLITE